MLIFLLNLKLSTKSSEVVLSSWSTHNLAAIFFFKGGSGVCKKVWPQNVPFIHIKASTTLTRFWKYPFSSQSERRKIISPTLAFFFSIGPHWRVFIHSKTDTFWCVFPYRPPNTPENADWLTDWLFSKRCVYFRNRFQKPLFSSAFLVALVCMIGENSSKSMDFQTKTHQCGRRLHLYFMFSVSCTVESWSV